MKQINENFDKVNELTSSYHDWLVSSLKNKKRAALYLQVALDEYQKDNNSAALLLALRNVTEAQGGIGQLAQKSHLNRESLYRTLSRKGNPKLQTLGALLKGLGFELQIRPAS